MRGSTLVYPRVLESREYPKLSIGKREMRTRNEMRLRLGRAFGEVKTEIAIDSTNLNCILYLLTAF